MEPEFCAGASFNRQAGNLAPTMGRTALELALREHPELRDKLLRAERDLTETLDTLRPYAADAMERSPQGPRADPDLRYQVEIIERALAEIAFILRPEESAFI